MFLSQKNIFAFKKGNLTSLRNPKKVRNPQVTPLADHPCSTYFQIDNYTSELRFVCFLLLLILKLSNVKPHFQK